MDVITSHINADFDAFASMVAAKKIYPNAALMFPGAQEKKLRDFLDAFADEVPEIKRLKDVDLESVRRLIVVDTKSVDRLGPLADVYCRPGVNTVLYDHHRHEEEDLRGTMEIIEMVGASSTIFAELLKERNLPPTPMEATILCMGIYEETGNLIFPSTTERDLQAAAWLLKCGASLNIVATYLRTELSRSELDLLNELSKSAREVAVGSVRILVAKASRDEYLGDAAHLAHKMMDMEDTDAVVLILRMADKVLLVGRSRAPEVNVARVMEQFGGGGHPTAASATLREEPLEVLEEKVSSALRAFTKPGKFAVDVMTRPVITIDSESTVKLAEEMMTRYGVNVLPVERDGLYQGIISREIVEKALFHGFRKSPITDFMTTDAETADKYTPVRELESIMIEQNQRFIPVVEEERIEGAITRTDIMRSLYEDYLRRTRVKAPLAEERRSIKKNLTSWMENRYPAGVMRVLRVSGEVARSLGFAAYLVGGSVRDLLRAEANLDMDIVIEGDGIAFARALADRLGGRVRSHERFGTAKVITPERKIDVASARTEYYETPASLPKVVMSSIKKDLYRRDFTINTLAVKLNPGDFGQLVDFFGGQRDLKDKTIRVLHNLSFVEDPTRAFRALRFAERFGFKVSRHTENLIKSTLRMDLFSRLSGTRLYEELCLIFDEKDPARVIERLADYGLLRVIHPALEITDRVRTLLGSVQDALLWFEMSFRDEHPDRRIIHLMALISGLKDDEKAAALERLSVPARIRQAVVGNIRQARETVRLLPLEDPAELHELLTGLSLETVLFVMADTENEEKKHDVSTYLLVLRRVKPELDGNDLMEMGIEPGPVYSDLLGAVLHEKLRGRLATKEEERRFVLQCLRATAPRSRTGASEG